MSHEVVKMTYAYVEGSNDPMYQHPWHKYDTGDLSIPVHPDASVMDCAEKADALFEVSKAPNFAKVNGVYVPTGTESVVHNDTGKVLEARTGGHWQPHQNQPMFEYCEELVGSGHFEHNTSGVLANGRVVFCNLMVKDSYIEVVKGDEVRSNLLFTNYHIWGRCSDVRNVETRAVCRNTVEWAHNENAPMEIKFNHQQTWDREKISEMLKMADAELRDFGEAAKFLASKRFSVDALKEYYESVFPNHSKKEKNKEKPSRQHKLASEALETQPGAEMGEGSWWQAYNSVTYTVDHLAGRSNSSRMNSAMYGQGKNTKSRALDKALEMAEAA